MSVRRLSTFSNTDFELYFAINILKLNSLHYGYWLKSEKLTLENMRRAQARYTDKIVERIPKNVKTILDIGSGIGDNARALSKAGFKVTAVSPDKEHAAFYEGQKKIKFFNQKYEDFQTDHKFDLVLMSESQNYFSTEVCLGKTKQMLRPGGYFLISGKFKRKDSREFKEVTNIESEFIKSAKKYGFHLMDTTDITDKILPTVELMQTYYTDYFNPGVKMVELYLTHSAPFKAKLGAFILKTFFRKQYNDLKDLHRFYMSHIDPENFKKYIKYEHLLFKAE